VAKVPNAVLPIKTHLGVSALYMIEGHSVVTGRCKVTVNNWILDEKQASL
jgi:hypothetical protein